MTNLVERDVTLAVHDVPLVAATAESFRDYGRLESAFEAAEVEIVTWPAPDWRLSIRIRGTRAAMRRGASSTGGRATCCARRTTRWAATTCWAGPETRRRPRKSAPRSDATASSAA